MERQSFKNRGYLLDQNSVKSTCFFSFKIWFHDIFSRKKENSQSRNFLKLCFTGSVFKLILPNLFFYLTIYITVDLIYIYWLKGNQDMVEIKEFYEMFCVFCKRFRQMIPINFLTGFYVTEVVRRYWDQFMTLPFPDRIALKVSTHVSGKVDKNWYSHQNLNSPFQNHS